MSWENPAGHSMVTKSYMLLCHVSNWSLKVDTSQFAANGKWLKKKKIQKIIWWFYVSQLENLCETYLSCFIECEVIPEDGILIADGFNIASVEQSLSNSNSLLPAKTKKVAEQNTVKPLV